MSDETLQTSNTDVVKKRFFAVPKSSIGWFAVIVGVLLVLHLLSMGPINDAFYANGGTLSPFADWLSRSATELFIGLGLSSLAIALLAVLWKRERSWLLLIPLIGGGFASLFVLGEVVIGHR